VQDRDANGVRLKRASGTGQCREGAEQSRATGESQKIAPRPGSIWGRHCKFVLRQPNGKAVCVAIEKTSIAARWCLIVQRLRITVCVTTL
jgi:hypothetical protein